MSPSQLCTTTKLASAQNTIGSHMCASSMLGTLDESWALGARGSGFESEVGWGESPTALPENISSVTQTSDDRRGGDTDS